jgi:DNA-binding CsgD family transcriptional regulator/tetratricopeptide (TPR) repeat protein
MPARLTSSHFVGRGSELAELERALAQAAAGTPAVALLGGDSGIGKTRLVAELERRIAAEATVLHGEAIEQGDAELPYAPLLSALRPLVREHDAALEDLAPGSLRELATLFPALGDGEELAPGRESGQLRLFEAVLELLNALGGRAPVALVLEDMHWADRSTRALCAFLARTMRTERVLLLLTYRTDELHRRHALRPLLSELDRLGRTRLIELQPFDRDELAEALCDILGQPPRADLLQRLFARAEGNPLYSEELLAAGMDGRGAPPQTLRDAFLLRLERLGPDARPALRAIAVGRRLDERTIAELTSCEPAALAPALREALSEQILVTAPDGTLSFRHALLREALYDDLLPGERMELHQALARSLERAARDDPSRARELAAAIATHYAAAGDQAQALRTAVAAARSALELRAPADAASFAERALELWPHVAHAQELSGLDHPGLLTLAADAHDLGPDRGRGETLLQEALSELPACVDLRRRVALLARLARARWALNRGREALETAYGALELVSGAGAESSRERAALLGWLARTQVLRGRFRDALADGRRALECAVEVGDPYSESEILNTLGMAQIALGQVDEGVEGLRRSMAIAREHGDLEGVSHAYTNLADLLNLAGHSADALRVALEGVAEVPAKMARGHDWLMLTVAEIAFELGDWESARAHLRPGPVTVAGRNELFRRLREAELALGEGDEASAALCLQEAEPWVVGSSEPQYHGAFGALRAELHRRRHELDEARGAVEASLDRLELCTDDVMRIARVSAVGLSVEADRAQRARDLGETADERDAIKRGRLHLQRLRAAAQEGGPVERAYRAVGVAELERARGRPAAAAWRRAAAAWDGLGRPYPAAIARWREAEAALEAGDRAGASEAAASALAGARTLGARWLEREVSRLGERGRLGLDEAGRAGAPQDGVAGQPGPSGSGEDRFGLTARELQVLGLLAEGATNRQIGEALFMAEKTASVHVSRILAKLGVSSRTQAAAVAHRLELAGSNQQRFKATNN